MIRCPKCGTSNEDDSLVCRTCAALMEPDLANQAAPVPPRPPDAASASDDDGEATGSRQADADDKMDGAATTDFRSAFRLPSRTASGASQAPGDDREVESTKAADTPARFDADRDAPFDPTEPAAVESLDLDPLHLAAIAHHGKGRPIVSVIGFPSSGKSFLVNRWRHELMHRGDWQSFPPPEPRVGRSPEGLLLTHLVPSRQGRNRGYVVVDCAGESFDIAFERQYDNRELEGSGVRSYLTALGLASAYVLVLEADKLVAGPHREAEDGASVKEMMMAFHDILGGILVAKDRLREQSPEELLQQGISRSELDDAFEQRRRFDTPICVAFAQADRLQGLREMGVPVPGFDRDPYLFALSHARFLHNAITRRFDHYRFDFISAFPGYEPDHEGKPSPAYHLPSYGSAALFDWIDRLLKPRLPGVGRLTRLASGGVPTRHAVRLRRTLDPAFRRQTRHGGPGGRG